MAFSDSPVRKRRLVGFAGWSGAGKTSLMIRVIPILTRRGFTVSTVKHAHHAFDIDRPGKDSWLHREAGATEVMVASANRFALIHELRGADEPGLEELLSRMTPTDIVLVEGFRHGLHRKIEIFRPELDKPALHPGDPMIVAIASPAPPERSALPWLPLDDAEAIAEFIASSDSFD
jgi:molybdopterin-guanine dinucleotide biosynthesis protein B